MIQAGEYEVIIDRGDGRGPVQVAKLSAPECFGELALMYGTPRAATIRAIGQGPHTCWATDRATFRGILMSCFSQQLELYEGILDEIDLFRDHMDKYDRTRLVDAFQTEQFEEGQVIVREGDEGTSFFVIEEGEAIVTKNSNAEETVNTLRKGQFFGELSLLLGTPRHATVTAKTQLRLAVLSAEAFQRLIPADVRKLMSEAATHYQLTEDPSPRRRFPRRSGVSAETGPEEDEVTAIIHDKTPQERETIAKTLSDNMLFTGLNQEQLDSVIDRMYRMEFTEDHEVITQGMSDCIQL